MKHTIFWICSVIAILAGLFITRSAYCLWGLFVPLFASAIVEEEE
jgi:hypothetical protein